MAEEEVVERAAEIALERFREKFNCAEATLIGLVEAFGLDQTNVPRIATPFGGGMGGTGEACGALVGAFMALGLKFGRDRADDLDAKAAASGKARELLRVFQAQFGRVRCIELTGCDMSTLEGMARAKELDLHMSFCPKFVESAAREAARLLAG